MQTATFQTTARAETVEHAVEFGDLAIGALLWIVAPISFWMLMIAMVAPAIGLPVSVLGLSIFAGSAALVLTPVWASLSLK